MCRNLAWSFVCSLAALAITREASATLPSHGVVENARPSHPFTVLRTSDRVNVAHPATMAGLSQIDLPTGTYTLHHEILTSSPGSWFVEIPECIGRGAVTVDGTKYTPPHGPFVVRLATTDAHVVDFEAAVTGYEARLACSSDVKVGNLATARTGFFTLDFTSPETLGGHAVLYVPPHHDVAAKGPLLVGLHAWNSSMWSYAATLELVRAADAKDVVLLFPSGLGNSLYTAYAEAEVLRAIDAAKNELAIDAQRISIWGASMGGAGATTIGLHHPDLFASITSFFGDSKYDLSTYVRSILPTESAAHLVNALDVSENARHVPIWLFHGLSDTVSSITQSEMLARDLSARSGYIVRFERVPGMGHSGKLVARYIEQVVGFAATAKAEEHPRRVTFKSVRAQDTSAYGVHWIKRHPGDSAIDLEYKENAIHILLATNIASITLDPGALGAPTGSRITDDAKSGVPIGFR